MRESTLVSVKVTSTALTADDISARIGIKPDTAWKAGAMRGAFRVVEKEHGLLLETKLQNFNPLSEHVQDMLKRLSPSAQKLGELAGQVSVEFVCTLARKTAPIVKFTRDELRWLAVMGAVLTIDLTIITEPPKPAAGTPGAKPPNA